MEEQQVAVTCPNCGFCRAVPRSSIPLREVRATCPRCAASFILTTAEVEAAVLPPTEAPPPYGPTGYPPAACDTTSSGPAHILTISFQGSGSEYFGIWIVNTLLKIVTCGIYSAWAKVRKRCYFYGNTLLEGEPFFYLADPLIIFKGWMIGAAAFLLYMIAQHVSAILSGIIGLAILLSVPWLVVRSRMFNARNSAHRNICFAFIPNYRDAYLVFLGLPFLSIFTLGLLMPYALYRQKRFLVENSFYGTTPCTFTGTPGQYYRVYLAAALAMAALFAVSAGLLFLLGGSAGLAGAARGGAPPAGFVAFFTFVPLLVYFLFIVYLQTSLANLGWNGTAVGTISFRSALRLRDMAWLYFSNAVAIACTFGLLIPWASVRMARYRCSTLTAQTHHGLNDFLALSGRGEVGAAGEEIGDIFGVNADFGF